MNLAQANFGKSNTLWKLKDGSQVEVQEYSYESGKVLYHVLQFPPAAKVGKSGRAYRVNCGPLSNMIQDIRPIHYEIEKHFGV